MVKKRVAKDKTIPSALRASAEWCVLDSIELSRVEQASVCSEYDTGDVIFYEGDTVKGVYFVKNGLVGVRKADIEGNSTLIKMAVAGDTLGYRPLAANQPHRGSGEILKPSIVCFVDRATVQSLIRANPALGLNFLARAARELGDAEEKFHESVTLSVRARFAHLIMHMQEQYGSVATDGAVHFDLPVSRSDLAAMLGVRRESVSRTIHEIEKLGIAKFKDRGVVVHETESLLKEFHK